MFRFLIFDEVNLYIVSMITFYGLVRFTFTLNLKNKIAPRLHTPMLLVFFFFLKTGSTEEHFLITLASVTVDTVSVQT